MDAPNQIAPSRADEIGARPVSSKRRAFDIHSWLGFQLCALFSLVLLTGTFATVSNEIDWLVSGNFRVVPKEARASWQEMQEAARKAFPDQGIWWIALGPGERYAATVVTVDANEFRRNVRIDPYVGQVTGVDPWLNVQRFIRDLHRYLFMPSAIGLPIVASFAFFLLYQLYSGLRTAGRLKTAAIRVRGNRGLRVLLGDLHKSAGIWTSWFLLIIALTGIWYLAELVMHATDVRSEVAGQAMPDGWTSTQGPVIFYRPMDDYIAAARAAFPELEAQTLRLPMAPDEPVVVEGLAGDPLVRERANEVWLNPVDASVVHVQRSAAMPALHYITEIADPLHFGTLGGLPTKLLWFAMGIGLSGLSLTGAWLAWRRLGRHGPSRMQWLTLAPIAATIWLGWGYVQTLGTPQAFAHSRTLPVARGDGYALAPTIETDSRGVPTGRVRVIARTDAGGLNFAKAQLSACQSSAKASVGYAAWAALIKGHFVDLDAAQCRELTLHLTYGNGATRRFDWTWPAPHLHRT